MLPGSIGRAIAQTECWAHSAMRLVVDVTPQASTLVSSIAAPAEDLTPVSDQVSYGTVASRLPSVFPRGPLRWTGRPVSAATAGQTDPLSRLSVDIGAGASTPARNEPLFKYINGGKSTVNLGGECSFLFVEVRRRFWSGGGLFLPPPAGFCSSSSSRRQRQRMWK